MKHAVGIVIQNRWKATKTTLHSLIDSKQTNYDLFLVDNGSSSRNVNRLLDIVNSQELPVKQVFLLDEVSMSQAFNLFLHQSKDYAFRTKMDNDVGIFHPDTCFLSRLGKSMQKKKIDICSALPLAPHWLKKPHLVKMFREECQERVDTGQAFLFAACMMISKPCFDAVGYFNERLWRGIDIDYCKRAKQKRFTIGYADNYWVVHLAARTEGAAIAKRRYRNAKREPSSIYESTLWSDISDEFIVDLRAK